MRVMCGIAGRWPVSIGFLAALLVALVPTLVPTGAVAGEVSALLWRIEHPGFKPGYLFGTVHVSDPDIVDVSPTVRGALLESDMLVGEGVPSVAFQAALAAEIGRTPMYRRAGFALEEEVLRGVVAAAQCYGLGEQEVKVQPLWSLVAILLLLGPEDVEHELNRRREGARILDEELAHIALQAGKFTLWIESPHETIGFFDGLGHEDLTALLRLVAADPSCPSSDETDRVVELYRSRDLDGMVRMIDEWLAENETSDVWRRLWQRLLPERNHGMVRRIESLAQVNRLFVAVGAAHLPGEEGVIALLREHGWTVQPIE